MKYCQNAAETIKRLYEDNVTRKLTDKRFIKLSRNYEREQGDLRFAIEATCKELKGQERKRINVKSSIAAAKKYTDLKELNATVLREYIEKVYVFERDKQANTQEIQIVYIVNEVRDKVSLKRPNLLLVANELLDAYQYVVLLFVSVVLGPAPSKLKEP